MEIRIGKYTSENYEGNVVMLYGDDVAAREMPMKRAEVAYLRERYGKERKGLWTFDRLPNKLYVVGFDSEKTAPEAYEDLRQSAGTLVKRLKEDGVKSIMVTGVGVLTEDILVFLEGLWLADYTFDRYRNEEQKHLELVEVDDKLVTEGELEPNVRLWNRIYWCREWVNMPVADLNAVQFAEEIESIAKDLKVKCTVLDKKQIESLRMGGLLAVNKGSVDEPRFVILEYKPKNAVNAKPLALVGKGIMYDTGGLNIKPDDYMREMKSDMAGAATAASTLFAVAEGELPVWTMAFLPMTDNRPGFNAYAADDILTMYDGTTVEVVNTDAEGRLILADAIAYAVKNHQPELLIDMATLTGAAVRAIGIYGIAAMQQQAEGPMALLKIVGEQVHERIAEFPFWKEYDELIKSKVADIKNCGIAQAGAITAGKFLAHFAGKTPYVHLDIAGVAYFSDPQPYYAVGASGYGVRLLYAFVQMYDALQSK